MQDVARFCTYQDLESVFVYYLKGQTCEDHTLFLRYPMNFTTEPMVVENIVIADQEAVVT